MKLPRPVTRLLHYLNARLNVVERDPDANAYYSWADTRLDELAEEARLAALREVAS